MKRILLFIGLSVFACSLVGCSSSSDDEPVKPTPEVQIPQELIGTWKINYYVSSDQPNNISSNQIGLFIKFNPDNTIDYKDVNTNTSGSVVVDPPFYSFKNENKDIVVSNSQEYPGQTKFTIRYFSGNYTSNYMIGTKQ